MTGFKANYSGIDRMVHNLAMRQLEMQKSLSWVEDRDFDKAHPDIAAADPVFITSLPRAGTTLLLELLAGAPDFVSHSYRDMPFLLCHWRGTGCPGGFASRPNRANGRMVTVC